MLLTLAATAWTAAPAQAQWVVTPYLGINLAGDAEFAGEAPAFPLPFSANTWGSSSMSNVTTPSSRTKMWPTRRNNCGVGQAGGPCTDLNTDAIGYMGNVIVPIRITDARNWRPYATAGLGVIHSWVTDPSNTVADTN